MAGDSIQEETSAKPAALPTSGETESNEMKKRENKGDSRSKNKRKKRKNIENNHTWREEDGGNSGDGNDSNRSSKQRGSAWCGKVHQGSFANPAMCATFGVTIPPHLLPPEASQKEAPNTEETKDTDGINEDKSEARKFSKRKVAFLLAYIGSGYAGFQANEGQKTLQAEFELALLKSELLSPMNMGYFHKYSWSTSGRTDKGVHACAQVCSAKIQVLADQTLDDVRELINQHLPQQFRVLDVVRVTKSFCAKTMRSRVRYQYMIPSFCFFERGQLRDILQTIAPKDNLDRNMSEPLSKVEIEQAQNRLKGFRVKPEQLESLQQCLQQFTGTHSFHNFTKGLTSKDASATRYIISFQVENPVVFENGMEWVPTQVVGQSFLLHQIRKMISLGIDSVRMNNPGMVSKALEKDSKIITNLAPAQGLFLEMSFYDGYNQRMKFQPEGDKLEWSTEGTAANDRWKTFRHDVIMEHVVKEETREGNFIQYLYNHEFYFDRKYNYGILADDDDSGKSNDKGVDKETV